jgi:hypothetical protein
MEGYHGPGRLRSVGGLDVRLSQIVPTSTEAYPPERVRGYRTANHPPLILPGCPIVIRLTEARFNARQDQHISARET